MVGQTRPGEMIVAGTRRGAAQKGPTGHLRLFVRKLKRVSYIRAATTMKLDARGVSPPAASRRRMAAAPVSC